MLFGLEKQDYQNSKQNNAQAHGAKLHLFNGTELRYDNLLNRLLYGIFEILDSGTPNQ